jgi:hypothetical protein
VSPRVLAGTRSLGPSWVAGKRACRFSDFLKIFHLPNFEILNSDLPDVQNSPNFP